MNRDHQNRPSWDDQFAETEEERRERWAKRRAAERDPRDPDYSRQGIFDSGAKPCAQGSPTRCEYPHARND